MNETDFKQLVDQYLAGHLPKAAQQQFFELLEDEGYRRIFEQILEKEWVEGKYEDTANDYIRLLVEKNVLQQINEPNIPVLSKKTGLVVYLRKYRFAVAAAVLLIIAASAVWFLQKETATQLTNQKLATEMPAANPQITPAKNGAILTLDNGAQIVLDSIGNGVIANQGNSSVIKQAGGLTYRAGTAPGTIAYNTISAPRGRQYPNLTLSDGTKVWLDAGSSIRFPVAFMGSERMVEITGQVWFDVVHDSRKPFIVTAKGVEMTDLGTQFNVNAYGDENDLKVTLLQGAVMVGQTVLKPGEQALVSKEGRLRLNEDVDIDEVMAWKTGYFKFNKADIPTIMKQLSRWYDVDISYGGKIPDETFSGKISRELTLQDLLDGLSFSDIRFKIEGRKLIILP